MRTRRRLFTWVVETLLYEHNQAEGYVVRRSCRRHGRRVWDISKYFSESRYGSMDRALAAARRWKRQQLASGYLIAPRNGNSRRGY